MNVIGERTLYGKHWNSVSLCCKRFEGSAAVDNSPPNTSHPLWLVALFCCILVRKSVWRIRDSNRAAVRSTVSNQPSGLLRKPPTKETGVVWPNGFTTPVFCRRTTKTQPRFGEGEAKAGLYLNEGEMKGKSGYRFSSNCSAVMVALPSAAKVMPSADWGV